MPYIGHLLPTVDELHQFIIIIVGFCLMLPCPNDEFRAVGEETAGDVGRRIGLCPSDDAENPESCLLQGIGHRKDMWYVPLIHIVPLSFSFSRQSVIQCLLNSSTDPAVSLLSQSPLSTLTIFPLWRLMPPLLRK